MSYPFKCFEIEPTFETVEQMFAFSPAGLVLERPPDISYDAVELLGVRGEYDAPEKNVKVSLVMELLKKRCLVIVHGGYFKGATSFEEVIHEAGEVLKLLPARPEDVFVLRQLSAEEIGYQHVVFAHPPVLTKTDRYDVPRQICLTTTVIGSEPPKMVSTVMSNRAIATISDTDLVFSAY